MAILLCLKQLQSINMYDAEFDQTTHQTKNFVSLVGLPLSLALDVLSLLLMNSKTSQSSCLFLT